MNHSKCIIENCESRHKGHGYCSKHLQRYKKHGDPLYEPSERFCSVLNCSLIHYGLGYCKLHYDRFKNHGSVEKPVQVKVVPPKCIIDSCERISQARGYCDLHYRRVLLYGDPLQKRITHSTCTIDGCNRKHEAKGYCQLHYNQLKTHGEPLGNGYSEKYKQCLNFLQKASNLAREGMNDCILWPFILDINKYGVAYLNRQPVRAHRLSYCLFHSLDLKDLKGFHIAHAPLICRNPSCVNPLHLRKATPQENMDDKKIDNTVARGNKIWITKLTEEQVLDIYFSSEMGAVLAKKYNVTPSTVSDVKTGKAWGWLTGRAKGLPK